MSRIRTQAKPARAEAVRRSKAAPRKRQNAARTAAPQPPRQRTPATRQAQAESANGRADAVPATGTPDADIDIVRRAKEAMAAVPEDRAAAVDQAIPVIRQAVSHSFRRGYRLAVRDRRALQCLLASALRDVLFRHDLMVEAVVFQERLRTARTVAAIRHARLDLKAAVEALRDEGAPPQAVAEVERHLR